jgi:ribosomal protein L11 methyltransferase
LGKTYPALDVDAGPSDLILALLDDFEPSAVEERDPRIRIFFHATHHRDAAQQALRHAGYAAVPLEVDDEDWARRSQQNLEPVTVGRITILSTPGARSAESATRSIVIVPSTGFGTGHHATTRLCLEALQSVGVADRTVLDVGTGSGILAIASAMLGARHVVGIDSDPDAVRAARENLELNPAPPVVDFMVGDLATEPLNPADVVVANLTGAALVRHQTRLSSLVAPLGTLIASGILEEEGEAVRQAFSSAGPLNERRENGWISIVFTLHPRRPALL